MMALFDYNYQNPPLSLFRVPLGLQTLHNKETTKGILEVVVN